MGLVRSNRLKRFVALTILASFGGLVDSYAKSKSSVDRATEEKILLLGNGSEPKGIDPHLVTGVPESNILNSLFEGLVNYHPSKDATVIPGVAKRWESNEDASIWTFYLRKEARWSNGDPLTAHDFVYSYKRILTPSFGARYADFFYIVKNAKAFHQGEIEDYNEVSIKALDDYTLQIGLIGPFPHFLLMLRHYTWFPLHAKTIERFGGLDNRDSQWTQLDHFVGNGPFRLKKWQTNSILEVEKSGTYWDRETVKLRGIRFFPIEKYSTEEAAFRAGQLHYCYEVPLDRVTFYRTKEPETIRLDDYFGTYFYRFNTTRPPLDQPKVRKALALSIDKESIVKYLTLGGERAANSYVYPLADYRPTKEVFFDPIEARKLIAEAGFPNGKDFPKLKILINTAENHKIIAESIQKMWKDSLGIEVEIVNQEWKVYLQSQNDLKYDISRSGWIGDFLDPIAFLKIFRSSSGNNQTGWKNDEYDRLLDQVNQTGNPDQRYALMQQMEAILLEELPIAPIYFYNRKFLIHHSVVGWYPKLLDHRPYKLVDLKAP